MLHSFITKMLQRGAELDETLMHAASLSRQAYTKFSKLQSRIDLALGSPQFRVETLDPLVDKARQIDAIRSRAERGGHTRTTDRGSLSSLLQRRLNEYQLLEDAFPWSDLEPSVKALVESYIHERKSHHLFGDIERITSAYCQVETAPPIAC